MSPRRRGRVYLRGGIGPLRFYQPITGGGIRGCLIMFATLGLLGLVIGGVGSCFQALDRTTHPAQALVATPPVNASPSPSQSPSPSPQGPPHTVFDIAGTGTGSDEEGTSPIFYITPNSDWDLYWSYSCTSSGQVFFSVYVKDGDGSTAAYGDWQDVIKGGLTGTGVMQAHDPGGHERVLRLSIFGQAATSCAWTMKVSADSPTPPIRPAPSPSPRPVQTPAPDGDHHDWF